MTQGNTNTVIGVPESAFRAQWVAMLWQAMQKTGRGYRRYTLKNRLPTGASRWRGERRKDKQSPFGATKLARHLQKPAVFA